MLLEFLLSTKRKSVNKNSYGCVFIALFIILIFQSVSQASGNKGAMTKALIDAWSDEIYSYKEKRGDFPNNDIGLRALCDKQKYDCSDIPKDVWHNDLIYVYPSRYGHREFDLYSFGKNGIDDFGKGDDICNWANLSIIHYYPVEWIVIVLGVSIILTVFVVLMTKFRNRHGTSQQ